MQEVANQRLLIVGNPEPIHVGAHLLHAAQTLGLSVEFLNSNGAFAAAWPVAKFNWWLREHRPSRLHSFSREIVAACRRFRPQYLLATGICPIEGQAITRIGEIGILRLNFLTDDPWN